MSATVAGLFDGYLDPKRPPAGAYDEMFNPDKTLRSTRAEGTRPRAGRPGHHVLALADIYGDQQIVRDSVLPKRLITSCAHFHRQAARVVPPNGVRDEDGVFRVLEDNLRSPSGVSYVMENRRTMARVFPRPVRQAPGPGRRRLRRRAPAAANVADPNVVVLTPGVHNSAYFEHSLLARQMGVELVEGRHLFCRDNTVYMRTTPGEQAADVIYRRLA